MKKILTATLLSASLILSPTLTAAAPMKDIEISHPSYEAINHLSDSKVMNGYEDGSFQPDRYVQRQHIAATINRAIPVQYVRKLRYFKDVPPEHRNYSDLMVLQRGGILNGTTNNYFLPTDYVTRGQMAIVLAKAFHLKNGGKRHPFKDVSPAHSADSYISSLYANDVVSPDAKGKFRPSERVTRAQYADMLYRAWKASDFPMTPQHKPKKIIEKSLFDSKQIKNEIKTIENTISYQINKKMMENYKDHGMHTLYGNQNYEFAKKYHDAIERVYKNMMNTIASNMSDTQSATFLQQVQNFENKKNDFWNDEENALTQGTAVYIMHLQIAENKKKIDDWLQLYGY